MPNPCTCGVTRTPQNSYTQPDYNGTLKLSQKCKKCTCLERGLKYLQKKSTEELRTLRAKHTNYAILISDELKLRN